MRRELRIAKTAARSHRVITAAQLDALGVPSTAISRWAKRGRLRRRHRGVYVYGGGELSRVGEFLAAVLAIGRGAVLSHYAAAALWGFWNGGWKPIDVTVARRVRSRRGIRVHSVADLPEHVTTVRHGVPVTNAASGEARARDERDGLG